MSVRLIQCNVEWCQLYNLAVTFLLSILVKLPWWW